MAAARNADMADMLTLGGLEQAGDAFVDFEQLGQLVLDFEGFASTTQTLDTTPPAQPVGLAMTAPGRYYQLSWNANTDPDLLGYNLYRSVNGGPLLRLNSTVLTSTSYADYDLANTGDVLSYELVAVDTSGNESSPATLNPTAAPTFSPAGADPGVDRALELRRRERYNPA